MSEKFLLSVYFFVYAQYTYIKSVKGKCISKDKLTRTVPPQPKGRKEEILVRNSTRLDRPVSPRGRSSGAYLIRRRIPEGCSEKKRRGGGDFTGNRGKWDGAK